MEQPSESETLNGDTQFPRSSGISAFVATTAVEKNNVEVGGQGQTITAGPTEDAPSGTFSPPYWKIHDRTTSATSDVSISPIGPPPIQLEDRSDEDHEVGRACWAKHVTIEDYVVVGGGAIAGAYVVWNCTVETLKGAPFTIRKRFVFSSCSQRVLLAWYACS